MLCRGDEILTAQTGNFKTDLSSFRVQEGKVLSSVLNTSYFVGGRCQTLVDFILLIGRAGEPSSQKRITFHFIISFIIKGKLNLSKLDKLLIVMFPTWVPRSMLSKEGSLV